MSILRPKLVIAFALLALAVIAGALLSNRADKVEANPVSGFAQIEGGLYYSCGLTTAGGVKCWGSAFDPDGGAIDFGMTPTDIGGLTSGVTSISTGLYHTCAVTTSQTVKCLGRHFGALADVPAFGSDVVSISAGWDYTCVVKTGGGIACYFGNGTPIATTGLTSGITQVASSIGLHTCVLMSGGTVKCWGFNDFGQIGDGTTVARPTAVTVSGLTGVTQISIGTKYSCALTSAGGVKCWGEDFGLSPVNVPGMTSGIAQISASVEHLCARTTSGGVLCRGSNRFGQLGDNRECGSTCTTPVVPAGLGSGVASINTGHEHSCAVFTTTQAKCWGFNGLGSLGDGTFARERPVPVYVAVASQKPAPTATPCPPGGCPSPTPSPTRPPTVLDFAIGIDANGDGQDECRTSGFVPPTCNVQIGSGFDIKFYLNTLPMELPEYEGFAATLHYEGVVWKNGSSVVWPECLLRVGANGPEFVNFACTTFLPSTYTGLMGQVPFTCTESGDVALVHGVADTVLGGDGGATIIFEPPDHLDELTINCVNLPATPTFTAGPATTATPGPVGGQAFDSSPRSDGTADAVLVLLMGSALVTVLAATLFVARRGLR